MAVNQVTTLNNLSGGAAVIRTFSRDLRRRAIPRDIYTSLRADHIIWEGQRMSIPNGIYQVISGKDSAGANNIRVILKHEINANILRGGTMALGTEVAPIIRSGTLYRANYRFVVQDEPGYHENKFDAAPYRLYQQHVKDLAPHASAEEGLEIRMALIETNGWNLQAGSTAATNPAAWSPHFFVAGLQLNQQPAFHPNLATYTNRIVAAIQTASGGAAANFAQTQAQMLNGTVMDQLCMYARRRGLFPLEGQRPYFVLTISDVQAAYFSSSNFTDTLGARWIAAAALPDKEQNWYGVLGKWISAAGCDLYVVLDERLATLLVSGTAEPFGLTAHYVWPTNTDDRQLDNPIIRDASVLHGAMAVVRWDADPMGYINDDYDYALRNGYGYQGLRGIQQLQFDTAPAGTIGGTREYFGSAVVVLGRFNY